VSPTAAASKRQQLIQIRDHAGIDHAITSRLANRAVIHYSGQMITPQGTPRPFPAVAEAEVARRIQAQLEAHNVEYGHGSLVWSRHPDCRSVARETGGARSRSAIRDRQLSKKSRSPTEAKNGYGGLIVGLSGARRSCYKQSIYRRSQSFCLRFETCQGHGDAAGTTSLIRSLPTGGWDGQKTNEIAGKFANIQN
jgi:hypothetical protein